MLFDFHPHAARYAGARCDNSLVRLEAYPLLLEVDATELRFRKTLE